MAELAQTLLIAHPGHWLVNAAYVAPVVLFGGWVTFATIRERRAQSAEEPGKPKSGKRGGKG